MNTVRPAAAILLSVGLVVTGCSGDEPGPTTLDSGDDYRVVDALGELPVSALEDEGAIILTGDLRTATDVGGLARPSDPADEAVREWLTDLMGGPGPAGEISVFVPIPEGLTPGTAQVGDADDLYGWSVLDVDSFAAVSSPPDDFTVVSGAFDQGTLDADLKEVQDGILTDRDGQDHEIDLSFASPLSRAGAPTRLARQNDRIAFSSSTPAVSTWLEGAESAAEVEALSSVARALDRDNVYSAVLTTSVPEGAGPSGDRASLDSTAQVREETGGTLPGEPFDVVGLGWGHHDGAPVVLSAYHFASDTAAEGAVDSLRDLYSSGSTAASSQPFGDYFTVEGVRVEGSVVVVSTRPATDAPVALLYQALHARDDLFTSR